MTQTQGATESNVALWDEAYFLWVLTARHGTSIVESEHRVIWLSVKSACIKGLAGDCLLVEFKREANKV